MLTRDAVTTCETSQWSSVSSAQRFPFQLTWVILGVALLFWFHRLLTSELIWASAVEAVSEVKTCKAGQTHKKSDF